MMCNVFGVEGFGGSMVDYDANPGCAVRPWAMMCNAFGVEGNRGDMSLHALPRVRWATLALMCNAFGVRTRG